MRIPNIYNGLFSTPADKGKLAFDESVPALIEFYEIYLREIKTHYDSCQEICSLIYVLQRGSSLIIFMAAAGFLMYKFDPKKIDEAKRVIASEDFNEANIGQALQRVSIVLTELFGKTLISKIVDNAETLLDIIKGISVIAALWYAKNQITDIHGMRKRAGYFIEPFGSDFMRADDAFKNLAEYFTYHFTSLITELDSKDRSEITKFALFMVKALNNSLMNGQYNAAPTPREFITIEASFPDKTSKIYKKRFCCFFSQEKTALLNGNRNVSYSRLMLDAPVTYYDPVNKIEKPMEKPSIGRVDPSLPKQCTVFRRTIRKRGYNLSLRKNEKKLEARL